MTEIAGKTFTVRMETGLTITAAAGAALSTLTTTGRGLVYIWVKNSNPIEYAVTNDKTTNITLNAVTCLAQSLNGSQLYYEVAGGLPAGTYLCQMTYEFNNGSGQYAPILKTPKLEITVEAETH